MLLTKDRYLKYAAEVPSPVQAQHTTPLLGLCQGKTSTCGALSLLPFSSAQAQRKKLRRVIVILNDFNDLARGGKKGYLTHSDSEQQIYRKETCLGEGESAISHSNSVERNGKKKIII